MKNKNVEGYDDRILIGYSGCASYERKEKKKERKIDFSLWRFFFMVSINRFNGSFCVTGFAYIAFSHHLISRSRRVSLQSLITSIVEDHLPLH
jgi:hypothetical protein